MNFVKCKHIDQPIIISKTHFYNLVIENRHELRDFIKNLKTELITDEGEYFSYYENDRQASFRKNFFLITDLFNFGLEDKKVSQLIQRDIAFNLSQTEIEEFAKLQASINEFISSITYSYELPLQFNEEMSVSDLLKHIDISANYENADFLTELINKIKLVAFVTGIHTFFIFNVHEILNENEFDMFSKEMELLELYFVIISSNKATYKPSNEFIILVDKDLCEIHIENHPKNS